MSGKIRNNSIDIFRYICAIMVVAIHSRPLTDVNAQLGFICTQIIPRIAVPFFFVVAGYYYIQKLEKNQRAFIPYCMRLLKIYALWSALYYLLKFCANGYKQPLVFMKECLYSFVISGSHNHFWFFPALIFSVCFSTVLYKMKCKKLLIPLSIVMYVIGCLGCSYYGLGIKIPVLRELFLTTHFELIRRILLMAFPFFVTGYLVYKIEDRVKECIPDKKMLVVFGASCLIWLAEIAFVICFKIQSSIVITVGLYFLVAVTLLVLLRNPLPKYENIARCTNVMANFTYYVHPLVITGFSAFGSRILHINIMNTPMYILVVLLTGIGGYTIYKTNNKYLNEFVK